MRSIDLMQVIVWKMMMMMIPVRMSERVIMTDYVEKHRQQMVKINKCLMKIVETNEIYLID